MQVKFLNLLIKEGIVPEKFRRSSGEFSFEETEEIMNMISDNRSRLMIFEESERVYIVAHLYKEMNVIVDVFNKDGKCIGGARTYKGDLLAEKPYRFEKISRR